MNSSYDYIVAGGGCAGLMLALELNNSPLKSKSILIIDREVKVNNDRTWCFWETAINPLEQIVCKSWRIANFYGNGFEQEMDISPYRYKMIRGIDFYRHAHAVISKNRQFTVLQATIKAVDHSGKVTTDKGQFQGDLVFNSYHATGKLELPESNLNLLQHFKGWTINSATESFDPEKMTYMDFRIAHGHDTRFCYVLPFSKTKALVEFTLFTAKLLDQTEYDEVLQNYIKNQLAIDKYEIEEEEFGVIPMTDYRFPTKKSSKVINIGILGGNTKASSGYTFLRIQKSVRQIVENLVKNKPPFSRTPLLAKRFKLYDSILLNVLANGSYPGKDVFTEMFAKSGPVQVFKFLDEETSLLEEIKIMNLTPKKEFTKAFFQQIIKLNKI